MKAEIQIETSDPEKFDRILSPSLESRGKVKLNTDTDNESFQVSVETDGLGPLRGTTDNIFRLTSLAQKITQR